MLLSRSNARAYLECLHKEQHLRLALQEHLRLSTPLQARPHDIDYTPAHLVPQFVDVSLRSEVRHRMKHVALDDEESDELLHEQR